MTPTEAVPSGETPMKIITRALQARPRAMKIRALLRSETLPMKNFDRP